MRQSEARKQPCYPVMEDWGDFKTNPLAPVRPSGRKINQLTLIPGLNANGRLKGSKVQLLVDYRSCFTLVRNPSQIQLLIWIFFYNIHVLY